MPPKSGFAEALGKVPLVVSLANRPNETASRAGPRAARAASARVLGRLRRRGRRDRAHAAHHGARPDRRQAGGRQVHRRHPAVASAVRRWARKRPRARSSGPASRSCVKDEWTEARQGLRGRAALHRVLGGLAAARRRLARRPAAAVGAQGRTLPRIAPAAAKLEGGGSHALLVYPVGRFYDGRGADQPWLQEAPDVMTQVTWDGWVEIPVPTTAKQLGVARGDLVKLTSPARQHRAARLSVGDDSPGGGGGGDGAGARATRASMRASAGSTRAPTRSCCWARRRRRPRAGCRISR